jgi:hypothetical protein
MPPVGYIPPIYSPSALTFPRNAHRLRPPRPRRVPRATGYMVAYHPFAPSPPFLPMFIPLNSDFRPFDRYSFSQPPCFASIAVQSPQTAAFPSAAGDPCPIPKSIPHTLCDRRPARPTPADPGRLRRFSPIPALVLAAANATPRAIAFGSSLPPPFSPATRSLQAPLLLPPGQLTPRLCGGTAQISS